MEKGNERIIEKIKNEPVGGKWKYFKKIPGIEASLPYALRQARESPYDPDFPGPALLALDTAGSEIKRRKQCL